MSFRRLMPVLNRTRPLLDYGVTKDSVLSGEKVLGTNVHFTVYAI